MKEKERILESLEKRKSIDVAAQVSFPHLYHEWNTTQKDFSVCRSTKQLGLIPFLGTEERFSQLVQQEVHNPNTGTVDLGGIYS